MSHRKILTAFALLAGSASVQAVPVSIFDLNVASGQTAFSNTVTGAGGTVFTDNLSGLPGSGSSFVRSDYTITNADGGSTSVFSPATNNTSGQMIGINPGAPGSTIIGGGEFAPAAYKDSGLTFTFNSAINALGFEVGDWGTCCQPSSLYIQFDGGVTQTVGTVLPGNFIPSFQPVFVSAIDDTDTFTSVTFWGDGVGEFLTAGGTVYYGTVDLNSVPDPAPEPASLGLLGLALAGLGARRARRRL